MTDNLEKPRLETDIMFIFRCVKIPEKRKETICCPHQVQTGQVFRGSRVKGVVEGIEGKKGRMKEVDPKSREFYFSSTGYHCKDDLWRLLPALLAKIPTIWSEYLSLFSKSIIQATQLIQRCIKTQRCSCWFQGKEWRLPHPVPDVQQQNCLADALHSPGHWGGLLKHHSLSQEGGLPLSQLILIIHDLGFAFLISCTPDLTLST